MKHFLLKAFTLIELLVVLSILSILFFIITPRFVSSVNPEKTKNFTLRLQNSLIYLSDKSVLEKKIYLFTMDLDERQYYFTVSEEGNPEGNVRDRYLVPVSFPAHLVVKSIKVIPGDEVISGKVTIPFTPIGMLFSFEITVEEKEDKVFVISGNNLSNSINIIRVTQDKAEILY